MSFLLRESTSVNIMETEEEIVVFDRTKKKCLTKYNNLMSCTCIAI